MHLTTSKLRDRPAAQASGVVMQQEPNTSDGFACHAWLSERSVMLDTHPTIPAMLRIAMKKSQRAMAQGTS
jgi:hypothetical protein